MIYMNMRTGGMDAVMCGIDSAGFCAIFYQKSAGMHPYLQVLVCENAVKNMEYIFSMVSI